MWSHGFGTLQGVEKGEEIIDNKAKNEDIILLNSFSFFRETTEIRLAMSILILCSNIFIFMTFENKWNISLREMYQILSYDNKSGYKLRVYLLEFTKHGLNAL